MKKRNTKHEKRLKRLVVTCLLCAIILSVSTYAWFIGMKKVSVTAFTVEIRATESLLLSLDGKTWTNDVLSLDEASILAAYTGNQNTYAGNDGLIPMSSVGEIDPTTNKMILFEKGSLTASNGGYRLMASRVLNSETEEKPGYVAFDLFVRNLSGDEYYENISDPSNEEAVYLTPESSVTVGEYQGTPAGDDGRDKSGIENSVRVAFAQIGRVKNYSNDLVGTDDQAAVVQGITCDTTSTVTGICANRRATIWEPNDTKHAENAIAWYTHSCTKRESDGSYTDDACGDIKDGEAYVTNAIAEEITGYDVDVYDGLLYNGYNGSITAGYLEAVDTFTDTEKDKEGTERPEIITLAPNSITKIRVYIYLEGQDVDNYDFASLGKTINVVFGFTKERFYGEDIGYNQQPPLEEEWLQTRESAD